MLEIKPKDKDKKYLLEPDERAEVLNDIEEVLAKHGLETAAYDDTDGVFLRVSIWRKQA